MKKNNDENSDNKIINMKKENSDKANNAQSKPKNKSDYLYKMERVCGNGSFGIVFQAKKVHTGEIVAIKKVYQDKRYRNREYAVMKNLDHPNIVKLYHAFYTTGEKQDEIYLNLVMNYASDNLNRINKYYAEKKEMIPTFLLKLYFFQVARALNYIHSKHICHRDIKPQNILIFPNNIYKIADMGEAKEIDKNRMQIATLRGSELFMSPLLYEGLKYNKKNIRHNPYKSDMFSLGLCFLYAICLNLKVLEYIREMKDMNSIKSILNKFLDKNIYSNKLIEIIYRMIDLQEEKRFDFEELEKELSKF